MVGISELSKTVIKEEEQAMKVQKIRKVKRLKIGWNIIADLDETDAHTVITLISQYIQKPEASKPKSNTLPAGSI